MAIAALAAGGAGIAWAAGHSDSNRDGALTMTAEIDGQGVRLDMPREGAAHAVALWFHGQGGDENQRMNEPWLNTLRENGWAVAAGELGRSSWGSPESVEGASELAEWASEEAGAPVRLVVAGSMGAAVSLNAMREGLLESPCWYGTMPVVDLDSVSNVPEAAEQMADVYGGPPPDESNPAAHLDELPTETAYRVLASPGDTWVPSTSNADVLTQALRGMGVDVSAADAAGEHGDPSHFDSRDLERFARNCV